MKQFDKAIKMRVHRKLGEIEGKYIDRLAKISVKPAGLEVWVEDGVGTQIMIYDISQCRKEKGYQLIKFQMEMTMYRPRIGLVFRLFYNRGGSKGCYNLLPQCRITKVTMPNMKCEAAISEIDTHLRHFGASFEQANTAR